jgi:hypothetical protein
MQSRRWWRKGHSTFLRVVRCPKTVSFKKAGQLAQPPIGPLLTLEWEGPLGAPGITISGSAAWVTPKSLGSVWGVCFVFWCFWGHVVSRCSTTWAMLSAIFCFNYFSDRILHFLPRTSLDLHPPTYAFLLAGITGVHHLAGILVEIGVSLFAQAGLNLNPFDLWLLSSWDYRPEPLCSANLHFWWAPKVMPNLRVAGVSRGRPLPVGWPRAVPSEALHSGDYRSLRQNPHYASGLQGVTVPSCLKHGEAKTPLSSASTPLLCLRSSFPPRKASFWGDKPPPPTGGAATSGWHLPASLDCTLAKASVLSRCSKHWMQQALPDPLLPNLLLRCRLHAICCSLRRTRGWLTPASWFKCRRCSYTPIPRIQCIWLEKNFNIKYF